MVIPRALWPPVATLAAMALLGMLLQPVTLLAVTTDDGRDLACRRIAAGDTVTLVFTHSMYGGEVRETWRPAGARLARVSIETDRAAAAEYYATDGAVERTDGGFAVVSPPLFVDTLTVRIDQIGAHRLRFANDEVSLVALVEGSAAATMQLRQVTLIEDLLTGCRG